jgi:hypothetical protein
MPKVSEFYGISIYFYYRDHDPPHFHAIYSGDQAVFEIETLDVLEGRLPRRANALVLEWAAQHRLDLMHVWRQARAKVALDAIEPLG